MQLAVVLTAMCAAVVSAINPVTDGKYTFYGGPIHESFRVMLGRKATDAEVMHFGYVMLTGQQVSFFEPYSKPLPQKDPSCQWGGRTKFGLNETITETCSKEYNDRGGSFGVACTAIFRSLTSKNPDAATLKKIQQAAADLKTVASNILSLYGQSDKLFWGVLKDVKMHVLGLNTTTSNCTAAAVPAAGTDCDLLLKLRNGDISVVDLIHMYRSTASYWKNLPSKCRAKGLYNPHAVGEYITKLYRLRYDKVPDSYTLAAQVAAYRGGDTRPFLQAYAKTLFAS